MWRFFLCDEVTDNGADCGYHIWQQPRSTCLTRKIRATTVFNVLNSFWSCFKVLKVRSKAIRLYKHSKPNIKNIHILTVIFPMTVRVSVHLLSGHATYNENRFFIFHSIDENKRKNTLKSYNEHY